MVPDLEDVGSQPVPRRREQGALRLVFRVSHEQDRTLAVGDADHEGVVVGAPVRGKRRAWREHLDARPSQLPAAAEVDGTQDAGAPRSSRRQQIGVSAADALELPLPGLPQLGDVHGVEPCREAPEVVGMRMAEHDGRDIGAPPRAQGRGEHARADVDGAAHEAPAVDDHGLSVGQIDDGAVALTDVEEGRAQHAAGGPLAAREELEGQGRDGARGQHGLAPPHAQRDRGHRERDGHELKGRGLRHLGGEGRRGEPPREQPDDHQRTGRHGGAAALRGGPPEEQGVHEAERQRRRLAHRDREQVGDDPSQRHRSGRTAR